MTRREKINEMCKRVGLPSRTGMRIWSMAVSVGRASDMVLIAQAISYASKNKHLLKEQWR